MANEKRLIDANELLMNIREKLVKAKCEYRNNEIISMLMDGFDALVLSEIKRAETVDAVILPCKPGTTVYEVSNNTDACCDCRYYGGGFGDSYCEKPGCNYISYPTVQDTPVCEKHFFEVISYPATEQQLFDNLEKFGKTVFLTREEAEAALAKMDGERKDNG